MKVLLSTGNGRLHLVQSATHLEKQGVEITLVQGWVPKNPNSRLVQLATYVVGHHNLADGLKKRRPEEFRGQLRSCAFSEFFINFLFSLSRKVGYPSHSEAARLGWQLFGWQTRKYMRDADIFHVRSGAGQGGAIAKARSMGMKVVVDHSIAHPAFMEKTLVPEYREFCKTFEAGPEAPLWKLVLRDCHEADCILVNSHFVKDTFVEQCFPEEKIKVLYLGVRSDFFGLKKNYSRGDKLKILFTGGFVLRKGAAYLLKALQHLDNRNYEYELTVAGSAADGPSLLHRFPIKGKIRFLGYIPQDDLKQLLTEADLYVFPSLAEGCASSCMEALAAGLPVITTRECGTPVKHGHSGWIVPPKNADALTNAIVELGDNESIRASLGTSAIETMSTCFTWLNYARGVVSLYHNLLKMN